MFPYHERRSVCKHFIDPAERLGELMGGFIAAEAILGAGLALVLCIAQIWALNAYYWSGSRQKLYYFCLYVLAVAVAAVGLLILGLAGIIAVRLGWHSILSTPLAFSITLFLALVSYFVGRRTMQTQTAKLNGIPPPLPSFPPPHPQLAQIDYRWPLIALATSIVIAAAIIYAALQRHPAPPATTPPSIVSTSATPVPTPSQASPAPVVRSTADLAPDHVIAASPSPPLLPTPRKPLTLVAIAEKISPSVVTLTAYNSDGEEIKSGTGFFVNKSGVIATNWHVISGAAKVTAETATGELFEIADVGLYNPKLDVALCSLGKTSRIFPSIADAYRKSPPRVGTSVAVLGTPKGLQQSLSDGIVSAIRSDDIGTLIQITAPVSPGSSGSPVIDNTGALIGIATLVTQEGQNLNFARSFSDLVAIWHDLRPHTFGQVIAERSDALTASGLCENYDRADMRGKIQLASAIRETFPDVCVSYMFTGETFIGLHDLKHAIAEFEQARLLCPEIPNFWERLGELYREVGQMERSQECFSHAKMLTKQLREKGTIQSKATAQQQGEPQGLSQVSQDLAAFESTAKQMNEADISGGTPPTSGAEQPPANADTDTIRRWVEDAKRRAERSGKQSTSSALVAPLLRLGEADNSGREDFLPGIIVKQVNGADCHVIRFKPGWQEGDLINTRAGPGQNYTVANKIAVGEKGLVMEFRTTSNKGTPWVRVFRWNSEKKDSATFIGWANKNFVQFDR